MRASLAGRLAPTQVAAGYQLSRDPHEVLSWAPPRCGGQVRGLGPRDGGGRPQRLRAARPREMGREV